MSGAKILEISMGPMSYPLAEQLAEQGLTIADKLLLGRLQEEMVAISRLNMRGYIPDNVAAKARAKLMKNLVAKVQPL